MHHVEGGRTTGSRLRIQPELISKKDQVRGNLYAQGQPLLRTGRHIPCGLPLRSRHIQVPVQRECSGCCGGRAQKHQSKYTQEKGVVKLIQTGERVITRLGKRGSLGYLRAPEMRCTIRIRMSATQSQCAYITSNSQPTLPRAVRTRRILVLLGRRLSHACLWASELYLDKPLSRRQRNEQCPDQW